MKSLTKRSLLPLAVVGAFAGGLSGNAAASVYGGATINIDEAQIDIRNGDGTLATITSFDFRSTTGADLNGVTNAQAIQSCGGIPIFNSCRPGGALSGDYAAIPLNSAPASLGIVRGDNTFTFLGPNGTDFGSSDNVVWDAALANPVSAGCTPGVNCDIDTHVQGIAEAELANTGTAGATSTIRSTNNFSLEFALTLGNGTFDLSFLADPDLYSELFGPNLLFGTASSSVTTTFRLSGGDGEEINWAPDGTLDAAVDCTSSGGATCTEIADTQTLNADTSAPLFGLSGDAVSWDPLADILTAFEISISGLSAGNYSFTLQTTQEAKVTRFNVVPAPATIGLIGLGMTALGWSTRRRRKG